ncbi:MAG TPA: S8 family serine peptidase [Sphingomicrobium sp.]
MSKRRVLTIILVGSLASSSAIAQLGGGLRGTVGQLGGTVRNTVGTIGGVVGGTVEGATGTVGGIVGGPVGSALGKSGSNLGGATYRLTGSRIAYRSDPPPSEGTSSALAGFNTSQLLEESSLDDLTPVTGYLQLGPAEFVELRRLRHDALIDANRKTLDRDDYGQPVRKRELIAVDPDAASLATAQRAGFSVMGVEAENSLGIRMVTLSLPRGMNVRKALKLLRRSAPAMQVDYNHIYEPAGGALLPAMGVRLAAYRPVRRGTRIAMIDGGVAAHPSLANASIEQRGFAGNAEPTGHGTAVASLLVGNQGPFRGAARGAELFVGDVYGGNPAAGSAIAVVQALNWAASKQPSVVNVSLVGPHNRTLARAIAVLRARGIQVVAAVGNDGPAAPAAFPASYPGVLAITGVDAADRALREAGQAVDLDFAAPGADLVAALPGTGYTPVRGTSFAAPFVAARLAATGSPATLATEAVPGKGKVGRGIVCRTCRILPKVVGLR